MDQVIIGVDPHKLSVTIEARDSREILRAKFSIGMFGSGPGRSIVSMPGCRKLLLPAHGSIAM